MKKSQTKKLSSSSVLTMVIILSAIIASCNKSAGTGGTAMITGNVVGIDHDFARAEITAVTFTNGSLVEHGDYWLLNHPDLNKYYYIWYHNPNWISNGDPGLQGRTGIEVMFNYSDSNLDIATHTKDSIQSVTSDFMLALQNDILQITSSEGGVCPDAEDMTSPFNIDIVQQGKDVVLSSEMPLHDVDVYIVYGDNSVYDDSEETGEAGGYKFERLLKGDYKVYVYTKDTVNGGSTLLQQEVTISKNGEVVELDDFKIVY
ncbi:MAG: hypothetical protein HUJ25_04785 [Crocinitomicaceae bacterium]|nr:hypothetical protein [Crocinitomicaceae bacterium]